ncbi:trypco2 family protein [Glycomyces sp. NPDC047010]|uniref:trypco2 family protein n=1 Tax=Glycomyces sp. NPDC047010 TaxID=3155023 RepID=UPI0033E796A8
MTDNIPLRRALASLRDELARSQQDRNPIFALRIDEIEIELALVFDAEAALEVEAGIESKMPWLVVGKTRAKVNAKANDSNIHRLTLKITPIVPAAEQSSASSGSPRPDSLPEPSTSSLKSGVSDDEGQVLLVGRNEMRSDPAASLRS